MKVKNIYIRLIKNKSIIEPLNKIIGIKEIKKKNKNKKIKYLI